ncbi:hypothetical protein B0H13DRAFT_1898519 [Mycena leptocephala]|nr:hypothetical protein B0H13DRAFT_1898519 [Mycena leptocephala]
MSRSREHHNDEVDAGDVGGVGRSAERQEATESDKECDDDDGDSYHCQRQRMQNVQGMMEIVAQHEQLLANHQMRSSGAVFVWRVVPLSRTSSTARPACLNGNSLRGADSTGREVQMNDPLPSLTNPLAGTASRVMEAVSARRVVLSRTSSTARFACLDGTSLRGAYSACRVEQDCREVGTGAAHSARIAAGPQASSNSILGSDVPSGLLSNVIPLAFDVFVKNNFEDLYGVAGAIHHDPAFAAISGTWDPVLCESPLSPLCAAVQAPLHYHTGEVLQKQHNAGDGFAELISSWCRIFLCL